MFTSPSPVLRRPKVKQNKTLYPIPTPSKARTTTPSIINGSRNSEKSGPYPVIGPTFKPVKLRESQSVSVATDNIFLLTGWRFVRGNENIKPYVTLCCRHYWTNTSKVLKPPCFKFFSANSWRNVAKIYEDQFEVCSRIHIFLMRN